MVGRKALCHAAIFSQRRRSLYLSWRPTSYSPRPSGALDSASVDGKWHIEPSPRNR